jgi:arylsulfatase A
MADDLGYGDLGCYGQKVIRTPHLDRMAREGMRFTQFYAGATVCAPRAAC